MKIGIDIDDVLADFIPVFRTWARVLTGKPTLNIEPRDWAWSNFEMSKEELDYVWKALKEQYEFHLTLPTLPDTDSLSALEAQGHELYFITARFQCLGRPAHLQTALWLKEHYGLQFPVVLVATDKAAIAKALNLDAFIDDRAETCEAVAQALPACRVAVKDREHNQHCNPAIWRVRNFNEFIGHVTAGN